MTSETLSRANVSTEPAEPAAATASTAEAPLLKNILVPLDLSAPALKALDYALGLAGPAKASVQLTYIVEPVSRFSTLNSLPLVRSDDEIRLRSEELLARVADENRGFGVALESGVRYGHPAAEILKLAGTLPADLIVLSTHGRTGLDRVLMGSVAQDVVRRAKCPVLVVRKHERDFASLPSDRAQPLRLQRILVPIDFSEGSRQTLKYAVSFARQYGGKLSLCHSIPPPSVPWEEEYSVTAGHTLFEIQRETALREFKRLMDMMVPEALRLPSEVEIGAPLAQIPDYATHTGADLIICGRHGQGRLQHALLGSVAEGLARHAPCPVLIVPSHEA